MTLVIDAWVAVTGGLPEEARDAARRLRDEILIAPELWLSEVANALWRRQRLGEITAEDASAMLTDLRDAPIRATAIASDIAEALRLALDLAHPVYDCLYLACALREDAQVITADRRFATAAAARPGLADRVRLLR